MSIAQRYYDVWDITYVTGCCNEIQFIHACVKCDELMGCFYCEFDYQKPHEECGVS
jgi:hypothetical protein